MSFVYIDNNPYVPRLLLRAALFWWVCDCSPPVAALVRSRCWWLGSTWFWQRAVPPCSTRPSTTARQSRWPSRSEVQQGAHAQSGLWGCSTSCTGSEDPQTWGPEESRWGEIGCVWIYASRLIDLLMNFLTSSVSGSNQLLMSFPANSMIGRRRTSPAHKPDLT